MAQSLKALIIYGTDYGQTKKVAEFCSNELKKVEKIGTVEVLEAKAANRTDLKLDEYAVRIIASRIQMGALHKEILTFAKNHSAVLSDHPERNVQVLVSMSAAHAKYNQVPEKKENGESKKQEYFSILSTQAAIPTFQHNIAVSGALPYTKYNFLIRWIMRKINSELEDDTSKDHEYSDWDELAIELKHEVTAALDPANAKSGRAAAAADDQAPSPKKQKIERDGEGAE